MNPIAVAAIAGGVVLLVAGAEALVRGASRLAAAAGVSSVVVGLTVVAFGTSAPELAVSVGAAIAGSGDIAVGNAVGSNVFNVLAILGVSAFFGGLVVHQRIVRLDVPLVIAATALIWWMAADRRLSPAEGAVLLAGIVAYTAYSYVAGRREEPEIVAEYDEAFGEDPDVARRQWPRAVGLVAVGLVGLVAGAQLLVRGATDLAAALGIPDLIVGLTVVAAGTSLPELATSVIAARRGERDIAVGNVVGSNLFNLLAVMGAGTIAGGGIDVADSVVRFDLPVALLVMLVALPALASGLALQRWEGAVLLAGYAGYVAVLVLVGTGSPAAAGAQSALMIGLVVMAVLLALVGLMTRLRRGGTRSQA